MSTIVQDTHILVISEYYNNCEMKIITYIIMICLWVLIHLNCTMRNKYITIYNILYNLIAIFIVTL